MNMTDLSKNALLERVAVYIAAVGMFFMFWQSMRDLHCDISDVKERLAKLETKIEWHPDFIRKTVAKL